MHVFISFHFKDQRSLTALLYTQLIYECTAYTLWVIYKTISKLICFPHDGNIVMFLYTIHALMCVACMPYAVSCAQRTRIECVAIINAFLFITCLSSLQ